MVNLAHVFTNTNWAMLAEQKIALTNAAADAGQGSTREHLTGILNWIDSIQDAATADGYPVPWVEVADDDPEHCGKLSS